jgi:hypothetical protein
VRLSRHHDGRLRHGRNLRDSRSHSCWCDIQRGRARRPGGSTICTRRAHSRELVCLCASTLSGARASPATRGLALRGPRRSRPWAGRPIHPSGFVEGPRGPSACSEAIR